MRALLGMPLSRRYWHRLEGGVDDLTELKQLSSEVRHNARLPPSQQAELLRAIQERIWLYSAAKFDGCG